MGDTYYWMDPPNGELPEGALQAGYDGKKKDTVPLYVSVA